MITCSFEDGGKAMLRHVTVHALVEKEGSILLVKRSPNLLEGGKWSLPSGFLDRDETAIQGVLRELREETGWEGQVQSVFFIKTDPNRPHEDRQNIAIHFIVQPRKLAGVGDAESTEISWMPLSALPTEETFAFDHWEAIQKYIEYRKNGGSLPYFV